MDNNTLVSLLKSWLKCESYIDTHGYISPSKRAIDVVHFYFIESKENDKFIESAKSDNQGGIIVVFTQNKTSHKLMFHVLFDGVIDLYYKEKNETKRKRWKPDDNQKGFGTDKYQFD